MTEKLKLNDLDLRQTDPKLELAVELHLELEKQLASRNLGHLDGMQVLIHTITVHRLSESRLFNLEAGKWIN